MTPKDPFLEGTFWEKFWRPIRSRALLFTPEIRLEIVSLCTVRQHLQESRRVSETPTPQCPVKSSAETLQTQKSRDQGFYGGGSHIFIWCQMMEEFALNFALICFNLL